MSHFSKNIAPYVNEELKKAKEAGLIGEHNIEFSHLENAHVLGQESTYWHVKIHSLMMLWGIKNRDNSETLGQLLRIIGAALLTAIKGVPVGNTGGSNVSPLKVMPIKKEYAEIITKAKQ